MFSEHVQHLPGATRSGAAAATKDRVMTAAADLFLECGYTATTIRAIAQRADVSVGTVMGVGDKPSLLVAFFDHLIGSIHDRNDPDELFIPRPGTEPAGITDASPSDATVDAALVADRLLAVVSPFLLLFAEHGELAREFGALLMTGREPSATFSDLAIRLRIELRAALPANVEPTAKDDAASAAYLAYLGALFVWAAAGRPDPETIRPGLRASFAAIARGAMGAVTA